MEAAPVIPFRNQRKRGAQSLTYRKQKYICWSPCRRSKRPKNVYKELQADPQRVNDVTLVMAVIDQRCEVRIWSPASTTIIVSVCVNANTLHNSINLFLNEFRGFNAHGCPIYERNGVRQKYEQSAESVCLYFNEMHQNRISPPAPQLSPAFSWSMVLVYFLSPNCQALQGQVQENALKHSAWRRVVCQFPKQGEVDLPRHQNGASFHAERMCLCL